MLKSVETRIIESINTSESNVFLRDEFSVFGSYSQVGRALRSLIAQGVLVKAGYGIYVKARLSTISDSTVPVISLLEIGLEVMSKIGVSARLGNDMIALNNQTSTQIPMKPIINIGNSNVKRRIYLGKRSISYEKN